jgi:hypothetical protein
MVGHTSYRIFEHSIYISFTSQSEELKKGH